MVKRDKGEKKGRKKKEIRAKDKEKRNEGNMFKLPGHSVWVRRI